MSRKRKKNSGNPARRGPIPASMKAEWLEYVGGLKDLAEAAMDKARRELLEAGATENQIDMLMRTHRCRIGYEALEIGQVEVFDWVVAPVANEIDIRLALGDEDDGLAFIRLLEGE